jgi:hypothetical protein
MLRQAAAQAVLGFNRERPMPHNDPGVQGFYAGAQPEIE